jgi:hypothetical protein
MSTAWSKNIILDPGTFGGTKACHVLVEMMNRDEISIYEKHRVLSFLVDCNSQFKWIATIKNKPAMIRSMDLMLHSINSRINEFKHPEKFKTYTLNVVRYMYRRNLRNWKE